MLLGEIGLNAVEARVMLAPEIDGLDGCFFADWAFKLVGHITDICNTKYCRIIFYNYRRNSKYEYGNIGSL